MMHLCECGCGRVADNVVSPMSSHELAGARYRLACADGRLFERIRARRAPQAQPARGVGGVPIGVTSSGEVVFGAGAGKVTRDGGRTYERPIPYLTLEDLKTAPLHSDLYDRVIKECEAAISAAILPQGLRFVVDEKQDIVKTCVLKGRLEEHYPVTFTMTIGFTPPTINCLSCSSPATHSGYCVYCEHRRMHEPIGFTGTFEGNEARARNERAFALEKPRSSATSRELAKGHPITWPSQDGEW